MLRNLLAEGARSSAFIPVFTEYLEKKEKRDVWILASGVLTLLTIALIIITVLGVLLAKPIVMIMAPGFINDPEKFALTVELTRWLFPFILLVSIAALFLGILNSLKKFSMPAFAPVVLNLSMISAGLFLCPLMGDTPEKQVFGWVIGALVGAFLEIVIQWIPAARAGFSFRPVINMAEAGIKKIMRLMAPATLAQSVTQINLLVNTILASLLVEGAVTYLYYGNRLMQLPFGVFGVAIATVSFPYISQFAARNDFKSLRETIQSSIKQAFFIVIPASAGLIFLSREINTLLFYYGRFAYEDAMATANVSIMYCIGIFAFSGIKILTQVFYAIDRAGTAVKISIASMILNVIFSVALMIPFGYLGLALAATISGTVHFFLLYRFTAKYTGDIETGPLIKFTLKITAASLVMGIAVKLIAVAINSTSAEFSRQVNAAAVFVSIFGGAGIYFALVKMLKIEEAGVIINLFRKQGIKKP